MKAVVLLSGGLDSTTVLAIAREQGFECHTLAFNYGQRHSVELIAARAVSRLLGAVEHRVCNIDMRWIGGSSLTAEIDVPKDRDAITMSAEIPVTYVPARNAIFLTLALAWAEVLGARDIFAGMNAVDYSGYPDCRPEFVKAWTCMARLGTRQAEISVHTPLIAMTKADIVREGTRLGVDYSLTHSCYDPSSGALACGRCDSCSLRRKGFVDADIPDPTRYAA